MFYRKETFLRHSALNVYQSSLLTLFPPQLSTFNPQPSRIPPPLPIEKVPVNRHRLDAARIIGFGAVHQVTDRINLQRLLQRMTCLFRKGRPTIALRQDEEVNYALCALCLHPIGYYGDTWAGVMCPTDEVIAHLLLMRGSEEKFWANANQHPLDHPAAGLEMSPHSAGSRNRPCSRWREHRKLIHT
jgi:hypothetical protein